MSVELCYAKIREFVKEKKLRIPEERLKQYAKFLDEKKALLLTRNEFNKAVAKELADEIQAFAAENRAASKIDLSVMESAARAAETPNEKLPLWERVRSVFEGGALAPGKGLNRDVRHISDSFANDFWKMWKSLIGPLRDVAADGKINRDTYRALHHLQNKLEMPKDIPIEAVKIAQAVHAFQQYMFEKMRQLNPRLKSREDYLIKQMHNREKIARVSEDEWVSKAMETYGEKSFPDAEDKESIFRDLYKRIAEGRYGTVADEESGDVMFKMARNRVLVAKDWEAQFKYNEQFGFGTIEETVTASLLRASRDLSIIEKFSSKPREFFDYVMKRADQAATPEERAELVKHKKSLYESFLTATGAIDTPAYGVGKFLEGLRTWAGMTKLGMAWPSSWMDISTAAGILSSTNGKSLTQNAAELAVEYTKFFAPYGKKAAEEALENGWIFHRAFLANLMQEMGGASFSPQGKLQRLASGFHKLTLMDRHVVAAKAAMGVVLGRELARNADTAFKDLSSFWKQGLERYGIGEHEWDTIRLAKKDWSGQFEGRKTELLTSDSVRALPDEVIENYLRKSGKLEADAAPSPALIQKTRDELNRMVGVMVNEHADIGSTSAGTRQRAFMYQGEDANSYKGMMLRLFWQFKSAALTQSDVYRRLFHSGATPRGGFATAAQTAVMATFLYAVGQSFKDALDGKTPEDPRQPAYIMKALSNAGAGGILASAILEEQGLAGLAGPVLGDTAKALNIGWGLGKAKNSRDMPDGKASRFLLSQIPGQNLLFTKGLMKFYFSNAINEFFDTGYLGSLERQVRDRPGLLEDRQRNFMWRPLDSPRWLQ